MLAHHELVDAGPGVQLLGEHLEDHRSAGDPRVEYTRTIRSVGAGRRSVTICAYNNGSTIRCLGARTQAGLPGPGDGAAVRCVTPSVGDDARHVVSPEVTWPQLGRAGPSEGGVDATTG